MPRSPVRARRIAASGRSQQRRSRHGCAKYIQVARSSKSSADIGNCDGSCYQRPDYSESECFRYGPLSEVGSESRLKHGASKYQECVFICAFARIRSLSSQHHFRDCGRGLHVHDRHEAPPPPHSRSLVLQRNLSRRPDPCYRHC
jgi:hypothetical protein